MYDSKLSKKLKFSLEPVAVSFTDDKPGGALQLEEDKWGCVASFPVASASHGKTVVFDEKTHGCAGGGNVKKIRGFQAVE